MESLSFPLPEQGQLVDLRHRRYVVTDVEKSALATNLRVQPTQDPLTLVTLSSVEDDALGEELKVVWELELGPKVYVNAALPQPRGYDDPARLNAFLDAVRWGVISSADVQALQSPFRSGIEIEDYQLDPVVRALSMPRVNLLIADDVGLGKTIETGLVVQELILRHRARTVLVVCPASLQVQWQEQMRDKFGLEFRIVDSERMKDLRRQRGLHVNPWTHFPRLITSMDYIKRERPQRLLREILPAQDEPTYPRRFDVLIVDEAHNVAPPSGGNYAKDSLRTQAIRALSPHFEHKLFLTATPHNGYPESFTALLELLDDQRFAAGAPLSRQQLAAVMVRRLKSELPPKWDGTPRFPKRVIEPLEVPYTQEERRVHQALHTYAKLRQHNEANASDKYATEFVLKLLKKRLFSSPAAFATTLEKHVSSVCGRSTARTASTDGLSTAVLRRRLEEAEEDNADDDAYEAATEEAMQTASSLLRQLTPEEDGLLRELRQYADKATARADAKAEALIKWLQRTLRPGGKWNDERVLIFTEYRTTQKWLHDLLAGHGLAAGERLMMLYGGMDSKRREQVKAAFQADPGVSPVRILLATDAASEGVDLQNHCSRLIHYEIPWNPNRMEQRNGRLDRHGQRAPTVQVYHFVGEGFDIEAARPNRRPGDLEGDLEFLMRATIKIEKIREDLGKVGPVIASQVVDAMLGRREELDTEHAEREAEAPRKLLRIERDIRAQLDKLHEQLKDSKRELHVAPENIKAVVDVALDLAGQPPLQAVNLLGIWPDPAGHRASSPVFKLPALRGSWALCSEGLAHPHTGEVRPITFDHAVAQGRDDVVLVHLNHRLVQMATRLLRAEIWSSESTRRLNRVAARLVPNEFLDHPAAIAMGRIVVLGGDNHRLHEELIAAGGLIREGRFSRMNVGQTRDALEHALNHEAPDAFKQRLTDLWPRIEESLTQSLDARMRERTKNLENLLAARMEKEVRDMTAILRELETTIQSQLSDEEVPQLTLWEDPEREQYERNMDKLHIRLKEIPGEIERETAAIRARYVNPTPRLFPVAVEFLVPEKLARDGGLA